MKYILTLLLTAGMVSTFAKDKIKLETDEEKYAYLAMFRLLNHHKQYRLPIEEELMLQAAKDICNEKASKVANEDMKALNLRMREKWNRKQKWDHRKTKPTDPDKWTDEEISAYNAAYSWITSLNKAKLYDRDILLQSAKDAFVVKINRLKNEQDIHVWRRLEVKRAVASNFAGKPHARKNWEAGVAFQKANKEKEGVKVTSSGLQYRVIKEGTGEKPTVNDTVSITSKSTLVGGKVYESSTKPKEVRLLPHMIQGLAEGLQLMKVGAKYELVIPPGIGWGMSSSPRPICSTLIIEVELVNIVKK